MIIFLSGLTVSMCGMAYSEGDIHFKDGSTSLLAYNEDTNTERYVLNPYFEGEVENFGFILPTPSKPELEKKDEALFRELARISEPEDSSAFGTIGSSGVEVVRGKRVGDFDAVILKANSSRGLKNWLNSNNYSYGEKSVENFKHYVEKEEDYYFTALKIHNDFEKEENPLTKGIRLNPVEFKFKTEKPLIPLKIMNRAHEGQDKDNLEFQLYTLSDQPLIVEGSKVEYSNFISESALEDYNSSGNFMVSQKFRVNPEDIQADLYLKKTDLFRVKAKNQAVVNPEERRKDIEPYSSPGVSIETGEEPPQYREFIHKNSFLLEVVKLPNLLFLM